MAARIMVIEDEKSILELLRDILTAEGYEAVGVDHPDLVLDVARYEQPDLFLIDIMLPRRSGIEVADQLVLHGFAGTPLVAMSASVVMRDLAKHTGVFQAVIDKPFDISSLLQVIERLLGTAAEARAQRGRTPYEASCG